MSNMTRAIRFSMPSPTAELEDMAELEGLADRLFAAATPVAAQAMQFNAAMLNRDLFDLECRYDPGEAWPLDFVAVQLAAWRMVLSLQRLQLTFWRVGWVMRRAFAGIADGLRPPRFCDRHPNGVDGNCGHCASARRRAELAAS